MCYLHCISVGWCGLELSGERRVFNVFKYLVVFVHHTSYFFSEVYLFMLAFCLLQGLDI